MSESGEKPISNAHPPASAQPARPGPRETAGQPRASGKTVYLLDPMSVSDLASVLQLKPFKVVADLLELKLFKGPNDLVDFNTAATVARKHGYRAERPPPGVLVL